jgi:hypothetical protein
MKIKIIVIGILVVFATNLTLSQSLESQLKIIFGDALSTYGKNDFSRFVGKALSTSGNMKYNMELINAQNKQELTINLPPNTSLVADNQVVPKQGYQWAIPSNGANYDVIPVQPILPGGNSSILQPYNLAYLGKEYDQFQENVADLSTLLNVGSTLNVLFTYNWVSDLDGNGALSFLEYNNIKRTFQIGEPICLAFEYLVRCGTNNLGVDLGDNVFFKIQIFNNANGLLIAEKQYYSHNNEGNVRFENKVYPECLGNSIPVGKYLISVSITSSNRLTPYTKTSLKEYFDVIN